MIFEITQIQLTYPQIKRYTFDGLGIWVKSGFGGGGHATWHLVDCVLSAHCGDTLQYTHLILPSVAHLH